jgi:hypothetical protein
MNEGQGGECSFSPGFFYIMTDTLKTPRNGEYGKSKTICRSDRRLTEKMPEIFLRAIAVFGYDKIYKRGHI